MAIPQSAEDNVFFYVCFGTGASFNQLICRKRRWKYEA